MTQRRATKAQLEHRRAIHAEAIAGWRPIATAPKDGTWILAYGNDMPITECPAVIFWDDGWLPVREGGCSFHVSHWQPFPNPPEPPK